MSRCWAAWALALLLALPAGAEFHGTVYTDLDGNGRRDRGEPPRPGVAVTNGQTLVHSDGAGRWSLPPGPDGRIRITRPRGTRSTTWSRRKSGDFGVVPGDDPDAFFFVHLSDVHAYDRSEVALQALPIPARPWWLPETVLHWGLLYRLGEMLAFWGSPDIAAQLAQALSPYRDVDGMWDHEILGAYLAALRTPGHPLGEAAPQVRAALDEIHALDPHFLVSTGDVLADSRAAAPELAERWVTLYREASEAGGVPVLHTIGNHGVGRVERADADPEDPEYGPGFFATHLAPTTYSADFGNFHFVALDSHAPLPPDEEGGRPHWVHNRVRPEVRAFVEADVAAHADRTLVLLNHEPFFQDPAWPVGDDFAERNVVAEAWLSALDVDYTLTGHSHLPGTARSGATTHISTGALCGLFWAFPQSLVPGGYRLLYAREGRLYGAWKALRQPVLGFVTPRGARALHPAGGDPQPARALRGEVEVVVVGADRRGPFDHMSLTLAGEPLPLARWGDYFAHTRLDAARLPDAGQTLSLRATSRDGTSLEAHLAIAPAP